MDTIKLDRDYADELELRFAGSNLEAETFEKLRHHRHRKLASVGKGAARARQNFHRPRYG